MGDKMLRLVEAVSEQASGVCARVAPDAFLGREEKSSTLATETLVGEYELVSTMRHAMVISKSTASAMIEGLEARWLAAMSAASLIGPVAAGSQWVYDQVNENPVQGVTRGIDRRVIIGPQRVNGVSTIQTDSVFTGPTQTVYHKAFTTDGARSDVALIRDDATTRTATYSAHSITNYKPSFPLLPQAMIGGTVYRYNWTGELRSDATAQSPAATLKLSFASSIKLVSGRTTTVRTRAGTFQAYFVRSTVATTIVGIGTAVVDKQQWYVPGIGMVKSVDVSGESTVTFSLRSYKLAR